MATQKQYQDLLDQIAALRRTVIDQLTPSLTANPRLAEVVSSQIDDMLEAANAQDEGSPRPADNGLSELVGIGPNAGSQLGSARLPIGVKPYDEEVTSERIDAVADLYYIYQHEKIGVFRAVQKLQELFRAGAVRLSSGDGAYQLYQYDRRGVLRYTTRDRHEAYRKAFGYCSVPAPAGAKPNAEFHRLFTLFMREVALFWRDKRVSEVIRERASDPSFGSIAAVRRVGLDLRNLMKFSSYGHLNVLRVEVMQLLDEAFRILGAPDIRNLFGADNAWDVVEEVLTRYYNESLSTSPRQRMAVTGRDVIRWLAQPHILESSRTQFEALLVEVAEYAEEWLTSAESVGVSQPRGGGGRLLPWDGKRKQQTA